MQATFRDDAVRSDAKRADGTRTIGAAGAGEQFGQIAVAAEFRF